jgi:methyltransferase (TIGR00027 family)
MNPISKTAFYTAGARMQDAASNNPVCGDHYAKTFLNDEGEAVFERFSAFRAANLGIAHRHRIIDDYLRKQLSADPGTKIIVIGAGFDSRAYRLPGGHWIELDEPPLIEYKNRRLGAEKCPNPLRRIPIDFAAESLAEKLADARGAERTMLVVEGVFTYLTPPAIEKFLATMQTLFPDHILICDLMTKTFAKYYSAPLRRRIQKLGAAFAYTVDCPEALFCRQGYRLTERISVPGTAIAAGSVWIPRFLLFRSMLEGYAIYVFQSPQGHER